MWSLMVGMTRTDPPAPDVAAADASEPDVTATPAQTRAHYMRRGKRVNAPIRRAFIQAPRGATPRHGPLAQFVNTGDVRGLNAYLLLFMLITSHLDGEGWRFTADTRVWARLFGTAQPGVSDASALTAVTRILKRLAGRGLISWERAGHRSRTITVTLLREDGKGGDYTRPGADGNTDAYVQLPIAFWKNGWDTELSGPAIAMLLVAAAEKKGFRLATERMQDWYGWSPDTAERGFAELISNKLLHKDQVRKTAPAAPQGWTIENRYTLQRPFKHGSRKPVKK